VFLRPRDPARIKAATAPCERNGLVRESERALNAGKSPRSWEKTDRGFSRPAKEKPQVTVDVDLALRSSVRKTTSGYAQADVLTCRDVVRRREVVGLQRRSSLAAGTV